MTREEIKSKVQDEIVEIYKSHPFLIIEMGTGAGKGKAVIECIAKSQVNGTGIPKSWLILVPEVHQIKNFRDEFIKFGYEKLLMSVDIQCYASFKNYEGKSYNIVLNEVQSLSDARFEILKTIKYDSIIADSATIPGEIREKLFELESDWYTYQVPLREAIELGMLPKPKIYTVPCNFFGLSDKYEYTKFGKKVEYHADKYYKAISDDIKYWSDRHKTDKRTFVFNKLMSLASQRKRFVAEVKTNKAREIIDKLEKEGRRYIIFCGSTKQADELGGKYAIHSKKTAKHNKKLIDDFNNLKINKLFPCGMLVSGMTLSQLDTVVVIQLDKGADNDSLKAIQQCGRGLRSENPEMYLLYNSESMDREYLKNAIDAIGEEYVIKL